MQNTLQHVLRYNCSNPNHQSFQLKAPLKTPIELEGFFLPIIYGFLNLCGLGLASASGNF